MKTTIHTRISILLLLLSYFAEAQFSTTAPYCCGAYSTGQCNQPGPSNAPGNFINDFIDNFSTTGGNTNISNLNSGCNANPNNCANHCSHYMAVSPGQTIVCTMSSGNTFAQGFAMWVDWNQDNVHGATEFVGGTAGVPAATTPTTITFVIPLTQPNGIYRMRVRCAFATAGNAITPCGTFGFGETEDYTLFVGPVPPNAAVPTGTANVNSPVCVGQALNFSLVTTYSTPLSYTWTGPGSFTSTLQNPSIPNPAASASGIYTVLITNSICPVTRTVSALVVSYPTFTPDASTDTICQGGSFTAITTLTTSSSLYNYQWTTTAPGNIFNPQLQNTFVQPALLPQNVPVANYVYSITVTPTLNPACAVTQTLGITINNPLTPTLNMPPPVCNIANPVQLTAAPGGGTWSANPAVSSLGGIFSPSLATIGTNTVVYSVSVGNCVVSNSGTLSISQYISPALSSSVGMKCVQDAPINLMNIVQNTITGVWISNNPAVQVPGGIFNPAGLPTGNYVLTYSTHSLPDTLACTDFTTITIPVFNPPVPVISAISPKCNTAGTVALSANPAGGTWSGSQGVSVSGVQTPSQCLIGLNTVVYSAGQGTCLASSSQTFHVSQFNTAALSGSVNPRCATSNPVNLMGIVQNTLGTWSGTGVLQGTNIFDPNLPTGLYTLNYFIASSPTASLCPDSSSIVISVLNPPQPQIVPAGPFCSVNGTVQLAVAPAIGSWVPTSYLTTNGVLTPSLSPLGDNYVQYVIGTSTCNASQTSLIQIEAFVPADITGSIKEQCNTNPPVNLNPITLNSLGTWNGTGIVGSTFNPGLSGAGNFVISYNTASYPSGLCPDQSTLAVQVFSLEAPTIATVAPMCNLAEPLQLQVSPVGGIFGSNVAGAVTPAGLFNPAAGIIGDNYVTYTISVGPCKADIVSKIVVEKFVSAGYEKMPEPIYCKNHQPFNLNSFVKNPGGRWSGGDAVVGSMFYPNRVKEGAYEVIYQTNSTSGLCPDESKIIIRVKETPVVDAKSSSYGDCAPLEVVLSTNTNKGIGTWNITDGSVYTGLEATHIFTASGTYSIVFSYKDDEAFGCNAQVYMSKAIEVYPSPKADFYVPSEEISIADPVITITNASTLLNENKYKWNIQGQMPLTDLHPTIRFDKPGNYNISLTATSINGCKSETSKMVQIKNNFNVHIPNSFTPNFDGLNDVFLPVFTSYGLDKKSYELEIFDRWGHLIFSTNDVSKGWDGTVNGTVAKEGTYVYRLRYKDLEGKVYNKTGHLNLIGG